MFWENGQWGDAIHFFREKWVPLRLSWIPVGRGPNLNQTIGIEVLLII